MERRSSKERARSHHPCVNLTRPALESSKPTTHVCRIARFRARFASGTWRANFSVGRFPAVGIIAAMLSVMGLPSRTFAQSKVPLPPSPESEVPFFYSAQFLQAGILLPPLPGNPFPELKVHALGGGEYVYDDRKVDYDLLREEAELEGALLGFSPLGPTGPTPLNHDETDLYLAATPVGDGTLALTLHNTVSATKYQVISTEGLQFPYWRYGEIVNGNPSGSETSFSPVPMGPGRQQFFTAISGQSKVRIQATADAAEPPLQGNGTFVISRDPPVTQALTVYYSIAGTAINGQDYNNAANYQPLTGSITLPQGVSQVNLNIAAVETSAVEFDESITLSLSPWHGYLIDPGAPAATILVLESSLGALHDLYQPVVQDIWEPVGIDYDPANGVLIVSTNEHNPTLPNFAKISSNNGTAVVTRWSDMTGLSGEIKLATVKSNPAGFTYGDVLFGTGVIEKVGRASAYGTSVDTDWATLTGDGNHLRGSLYVDRTGVWGYDLIAVTGNEGDDIEIGSRGVWRIDASGVAERITTIQTVHLEGAITVPDDPDRWGPWAGRILTGDESGEPEPMVYAIETGGAVEAFRLAIDPEDFDLIPAEQDLFCTDFFNNRIVKLPQSLFVDHVGDLIITQAGEVLGTEAEIFIVRWNRETAVFDIWGIPYSSAVQNLAFEHVTFAPLQLNEIVAP
jgi:hypothetical protein